MCSATRRSQTTQVDDLIRITNLPVKLGLRRQDMKGRQAFVAKVDRYVILFYPVAYIGTMVTVTLLFR